jgi:hypothetical protein
MSVLVPTDPNKFELHWQSVDPMPEHSDSGSGRSIRASSSMSLSVYLRLGVKSTSAIHTNLACTMAPAI